MIVHDCADFYRVCADLADTVEWLSKLEPPNRLLGKKDAEFVTLAIARAAKLLEVLGIKDGAFHYDFNEVFDHVKSLSGGPWAGIFDVRADELARDHMRIREGIFRELMKHKFLYLPAPGDTYFDQERLFGDAVHEKFPSARYEIREAGNAIAFEMHTAAVFHFMRAAEIGLRSLAKDRRISHLPKKRNAPVAMGTWEDILRELDEQIGKISNWPNTMAEVKVQAQEFYNGSITEYRGFKDMWRNHVMHTRREYLRVDALSALDHVKRMMQRLSSRISETTYTPLIWTKAQLR
jgi:hypothetical protein